MRPAERVLRLWRQGEPVWMIQRLTGMGEAYVSRIIRDYEKAAGAAEKLRMDTVGDGIAEPDSGVRHRAE